MANIEKKKAKLAARIAALELELKLSLQKKSAGPAINVSKFTAEIAGLKQQLTTM